MPDDVTINNQETIVLFTPNTAAANDWLGEHIGDEATWYGPSLVVEHRYAGDIIEGMKNDGLSVA